MPKIIERKLKTEVKKPAKTAVKKPVGKKPVEQKAENEAKPSAGAFFEAVGRRKTASARVRLFTQGDKDFLVN